MQLIMTMCISIGIFGLIYLVISEEKKREQRAIERKQRALLAESVLVRFANLMSRKPFEPHNWKKEGF